MCCIRAGEDECVCHREECNAITSLFAYGGGATYSAPNALRKDLNAPGKRRRTVDKSNVTRIWHTSDHPTDLAAEIARRWHSSGGCARIAEAGVAVGGLRVQRLTRGAYRGTARVVKGTASHRHVINPLARLPSFNVHAVRPSRKNT